MKITYVKVVMIIIERHNERYMHNSKLIVFAENINEAFAHISIDTTLNGIVDGGDTTLDFE